MVPFNRDLLNLVPGRPGELVQVMIEKAARGQGGPISREVQGLQQELRNHQVSARVLANEIERVKLEMAEYESRIENTARHAAELDRREATAANLSDAIRELQLKRVDARMGHTIELAQKGEKFRVVEWAIPPESPIRPNRPLWFIVGSILGVLSGFALLVLREMMDRSFHSVAELQQVVALPVLASVPEIRLPNERAARRVRVRRVGISSAVILVLIAGGTLMFYLYGRSTGATAVRDVPTSVVEQQAGV